MDHSRGRRPRLARNPWRFDPGSDSSAPPARAPPLALRAACARHGAPFLTHVFGRGLDDERYTVERFGITVDGEIQARPGETRKAVSPRTVRRLRPERNGIAVCTGVSIDGGVQYRGAVATGFCLAARGRR